MVIRIHCFENVNVLIFFVAINEYDQVLYEDESVVSVLLLSITLLSRTGLSPIVLPESNGRGRNPVRLYM